jgi:hypothetical protein
MASLWYNTALFASLTGTIDYNTDTFKVMLVTSSYTENKDTHDFRDDITNEISGSGYTAGGAAATVSVTQDNTNDRIDIILSVGNTVWTAGAGVTLTARKAVYYKSRGGAATADEVIAVIDFGSDVTASNGGTFTLSPSTLRIQN